MLKPEGETMQTWYKWPAAFGRLCVETLPACHVANAAGGPAAFGRLCVETIQDKIIAKAAMTSRLRAAVC